jgi:hypothetical protein
MGVDDDRNIAQRHRFGATASDLLRPSGMYGAEVGSDGVCIVFHWPEGAPMYTELGRFQLEPVARDCDVVNAEAGDDPRNWTTTSHRAGLPRESWAFRLGCYAIWIGTVGLWVVAFLLVRGCAKAVSDG